MIALDRQILGRLWPRAQPALLDAVAGRSSGIFAKYGINTPLRVAHFMAQISHESDGGVVTEENMSYSTATRIHAVWPSRFTVESAQGYVRDPKKLASKVYNGRMGNVPGSDDGYNYRGRGLLQITGRESYRRIGRLTGLPLEDQPGLAYTPSNALTIAAAEFSSLGCLPFCDKDDVRTVTRRVNGGYIGLDSRKAWLAKWKLAIPELPDAMPASDEDVNEVDGKAPRSAEPKSGEIQDANPPHKSRTIWGGVLSYLTGQIGLVSGFFDKLHDPYMLAAFLALLAAGGVGLWLVITGRLNIAKIVEQLSGSD